MHLNRFIEQPRNQRTIIIKSWETVCLSALVEHVPKKFRTLLLGIADDEIKLPCLICVKVFACIFPLSSLLLLFSLPSSIQWMQWPSETWISPTPAGPSLALRSRMMCCFIGGAFSLHPVLRVTISNNVGYTWLLTAIFRSQGSESSSRFHHWVAAMKID